MNPEMARNYEEFVQRFVDNWKSHMARLASNRSGLRVTDAELIEFQPPEFKKFMSAPPITREDIERVDMDSLASLLQQ